MKWLKARKTWWYCGKASAWPSPSIHVIGMRHHAPRKSMAQPSPISHRPTPVPESSPVHASVNARGMTRIAVSFGDSSSADTWHAKLMQGTCVSISVARLYAATASLVMMTMAGPRAIFSGSAIPFSVPIGAARVFMAYASRPLFDW